MKRISADPYQVCLCSCAAIGLKLTRNMHSILRKYNPALNEAVWSTNQPPDLPKILSN